MELLVVIAIIGILSSIVIASMTSARQKARDTKRISDIKQLQLALALYADANANKYPATLAGLLSTFITTIPVPPGGGSYYYAQLGSGTSYHLGILLETNSSVLSDDSDTSEGFSGTDLVFDVKP